jgi:DnaB-like helicase N terminal domain
MAGATRQEKVPRGSHDESINLSAGFVSNQSSLESPEPAHPPVGRGTAHVDDIEEPEGEETAPRPAPGEGWRVIAEEDVVQPHPHLTAETILLVSVMADNSLFDMLSALVADCFYSAAHQAIFTAMLALRSRGVAISQSTIEAHCLATGKSDSLPTLTRMFSLVPLLAVDRATLYRYIGIVKYQCLTRGLRWLSAPNSMSTATLQ